MQHGKDDQRKECEKSWEGQLMKVLEFGVGFHPTDPGEQGGGTLHLSTRSLAPCRGATSEGVAVRLRNLLPECSHQAGRTRLLQPWGRAAILSHLPTACLLPPLLP